jgi:hypothetical protein
MSFVKKSASAFGKLFVVIALAGAFVVGATGVVYMSLQGQEMKVPEITGKDLVESERELAALGLRIKKRADRYSTEKPNTILEQLPKAGDTVKTGQMILVVTSKTNPEGEEAPVTIKKSVTEEADDSKKIEELISDKPKKTNKANTNSNKKKNETTRDVISNNSNANSKNSNDSNAEKSNSNTGANKNTAVNSNKANSNQTKSASNTTGGDVRPRRTPEP